ncbi:MAG: hypothetical protein ACLPV4_18955 [Solirubrobacteraceae bacterium]
MSRPARNIDRDSLGRTGAVDPVVARAVGDPDAESVMVVTIAAFDLDAGVSRPVIVGS